MEITYDPPKRAWTLRKRGLDFLDAEQVFEGQVVTTPDNRFDYSEPRFITAGYLRGRCVVFGWVLRDGTRRVFTMRHMHADEEAYWFPPGDRPGD